MTVLLGKKDVSVAFCYLKRFVINKDWSLVDIQVVNGEYVFPNLECYQKTVQKKKKPVASV